MGLRLVPDTTTLPFTKVRNIAQSLSALLVVGSIAALFTLGLNFGIDFTGGVTIEVGPGEEAEFVESDLTDVRDAVGSLGLNDVGAKTIGGAAGAPDGIAVTVGLQAVEPESTEAAPVDGAEAEAPDEIDRGGEVDAAAEQRQMEVSEQIRDVLITVLGEGISIRRQDVVGPTVSGELIQAGITALCIAVGLMLLYIWFRFEWQFSAGAILALVHDVILTLGIFSVLQFDFTLSIIAALLTIIGYSMNDTVVVYDRIRENLRKFKTRPLEEVIDLSLNQTLSRTLMTSLTTLLALVSLFFLGGEVLRGFSFALIWGVLVGTYSSVFIASPILLMIGIDRERLDGSRAAVPAKNAP